MKLLRMIVSASALLSFASMAQTAATPPDLSVPPAKQVQAPASAAAAAAAAAPQAQAQALTAPPKAEAHVASPAASATATPSPKQATAASAARGPKKRVARRRRKAPKEPYADLPVNTPAKHAIQLSSSWADNDRAIVTHGEEGRVTFVFGQAMPTVVCAPLRMCDIALQPGEKVLDKPILGDHTRWHMSPAFEGSGATRTLHVIVQPREAGLDTNLIIPTDRRLYRLRLVSDAANYVSVVSFDYPDDDKKAWDAAISSEQIKEDRVVATMPPLTVNDIDWNYSVKVVAGHPQWTPLRAFNDGTHTYIQLPPQAAVTEVPALVVIGQNGKEQLVNFRLRGSYFVVDQVIDRAQLVSGVGREALRVSIAHGCRHRGFFGGCKD